MKTSELDYELPPRLIAQHPADPRDASRLMVLHRKSDVVEHRTFHDIPAYLRPGDCLVVNDTRVIPARFWCRRRTGGRLEALFLRQEVDACWRALLRPSTRLSAGEHLFTQQPGIGIEIVSRLERGEWIIRPVPSIDPTEFLSQVGEIPLPPYIQRGAGPDAGDAERYQTVYSSREGAVAAPTAGLHFTPPLLKQIESIGVSRATITLHVGPGTFAPIQVDDLRDHVMHREWFELSDSAVTMVRKAATSGGRIVAVGTTSARALETLKELDATCGWTDLFIYPPYTFRRVDALLTNFHLPHSTLLALVMAFAGRDLVRRAYDEAIQREYRFYSYGDAMLIL